MNNEEPIGPPGVSLPKPAPRPRRGVGSWIAVALGTLLVKAKALLVLLKGLKLAKLAITMGSMFVMIWFEAVRYGWANYPVVNLWNKAGLPASPFRTDDWAKK